MRLIDADKFIEDLGLDEENAREDNLGEIVTLEDFDRQETAYDVDKVIEEIEDTITPTAEYRYKFCGTVEVGRCASYESCECCIAERMIEIVKSGGVSDD